MKHTANIITASRIAFASIIVFVPTFSLIFYLLFFLCGLTDMLDGYIARKTKTESDFGARLDSIADIVFVAVCVIKIFPAVLLERWQWIWLAVIALMRVFNIVYGYICKKKIIMLHTILNKITGATLFILPFTMPFLDIRFVCVPVCVVATFSALDEFYRINKEQGY